MNTTRNIDDSVMASLQRESARTGRTMSELVETALRQLLRHRPDVTESAPLPRFPASRRAGRWWTWPTATRFLE